MQSDLERQELRRCIKDAVSRHDADRRSKARARAS